MGVKKLPTYHLQPGSREVHLVEFDLDVDLHHVLLILMNVLTNIAKLMESGHLSISADLQVFCVLLFLLLFDVFFSKSGRNSVKYSFRASSISFKSSLKPIPVTELNPTARKLE